MLEAVHSVIQTNAVMRAAAEQVATSDSFAANPDRVQKVAQAPYISPYIHFDTNHNTAVLALRDSETGDFLTTIPSDARLDARARDIARRAEAEVPGAQRRTATSAREASSSGVMQALLSDSPSDVSAAPSAPTVQQLSAFQSAAQSGSGGSDASVSVLA